jgi:hypothetical protein
MEKLQKKGKSRQKPGDDLIDGLPVLRGMFICPESLMENQFRIQKTRRLSFRRDKKVIALVQDENHWGNNWTGED